jgi:hypothetical protein
LISNTISTSHSNTIQAQNTDPELQHKLMKLPLPKKWEYLRERSVRVKTVGEEETEEKNTWEYYVAEMKSNQDPSLTTIQGLHEKIINADTIGLRRFSALDGFSWLFETLTYFLEHKFSSKRSTSVDKDKVALLLDCIREAMKHSKVNTRKKCWLIPM